MKKSLFLGLLVSFIMVVFSVTAYAYPTVFLREVGVDPGSQGSFRFPVLGDVGGVLYGEYDLQIDWDKGAYNYVNISGFCTENAYSTSAYGVVYELIPVADLSQNFQKAAWIFSEYLKTNVSAQAAQIAIWEVVLDTGLNPKTGNGAFYANFSNGYVDEAYTLLQNLGSVSSGFVNARNPVDSKDPTDYQNYMIPVPEPGILILLGIALSAVGLASRRFKF